MTHKTKGKLGRACGLNCCAEIVTDRGKRYCTKHQSLENKNKFRSANIYHQRQRNPIYSTAAWQQCRQAVLASSPVCVACKRRLATEVHHLKDVKDYPELAYAAHNLQALCKPCHSKITLTETLAKRRQQHR